MQYFPQVYLHDYSALASTACGGRPCKTWSMTVVVIFRLICIVVASLSAGPCLEATIFALHSTAEVMAIVRGLDAVAYINAPMLMTC